MKTFVHIFVVFCATAHSIAGKSTCIPEDLIRMLMKVNKPSCSAACTDGSKRQAFFAWIKDNIALTRLYETLIFKDVTTNIGNHYDPKTGIFTAPKKGLYQISCLLMGSKTSTVTFWINRNKEKFAHGYSGYADGKFTYQSTSLNMLMELKKDDQVSVTHRISRKEIVQGSRHSYFSGYLLFQ